MARSRSGKRDTNDIASGDPLLALTALPVSRPRAVLIPTEVLAQELQHLHEIEDFRNWHPDVQRPLLTPEGRRSPARLRDPMGKHRRFPSQTKAIRVFSHPNPLRTAIVCAKRKVRKEVLHALGLKRRGKGGGHKPRSNIKC